VAEINALETQISRDFATRTPGHIPRCRPCRCGQARRVDNHYYYIDSDGRVQGPFWLTVMRDLYRKGRLGMSTEVSLNGTTDWQRMEFHPEIFEEQARLPAFKRMARAKSDPVRLIVWLVVLFLAYATYVLVHWKD
jgi:hypothetical protein